MKKDNQSGLIDIKTIFPDSGGFSNKTAERDFLKTLSNYLPANFVMPADKDVEQAIIGCVVGFNDGMAIASVTITEADFHTPVYRKVYEACSRMYRAGQPIDMVTVTHELRRTVGQAYTVEIMECTNKVSSTAHLQRWCEILRDYSLKRGIVQIGLSAVRIGLDRENDGVFSFTEVQKWFTDAVTTGFSNVPIKEPGSISLSVIKRLEMAVMNKEKITGFATGINCLDEHTAGWQPGDLIVIAARPGMGKTSALISMVFDKYRPRPVLIFSLEMTAESLYYKLFSYCSGIPLNRIAKGTLTEDELRQVVDVSEICLNSQIYVVDMSGLSVEMMGIIARQMKYLHNIELIGVDYIGLARTEDKTNNRNDEMDKISMALKGIAKTIQVPVVCLSQLSRECEKTRDKRPKLDHLRDSGGIEQNADIVCFIYRPEYYKFEKYKGDNTDGLVIFDIAKYRNGEPKEFKLKFTKTTTQFSDGWDIEDIDFEEEAKNIRIGAMPEDTSDKDDEEAPF